MRVRHAASLMILAVLVSLAGCRRSGQEPIDAGVPLYPGARNLATDTFSSKLKPVDRERLVKAAVYETDDPVSKVVEFYRGKLGEKAEILERQTRGVPSAVIRAEVNGKPKFLMIMANEDTEKTNILIGNIVENKTR
jgi:hypothetical protein